MTTDLLIETPEGLTPRQAEIYCLVIAGWTAPEMAAHFGISQKSVEKQRHGMLKRMGWEGRNGAWICWWHFTEFVPSVRRDEVPKRRRDEVEGDTEEKSGGGA